MACNSDRCDIHCSNMAHWLWTPQVHMCSKPLFCYRFPVTGSLLYISASSDLMCISSLHALFIASQLNLPPRIMRLLFTRNSIAPWWLQLWTEGGAVRGAYCRYVLSRLSVHVMLLSNKSMHQSCLLQVISRQLTGNSVMQRNITQAWTQMSRILGKARYLLGCADQCRPGSWFRPLKELRSRGYLCVMLLTIFWTW